MKPIIFLDIDGVLNGFSRWKDYCTPREPGDNSSDFSWMLDPELVARMRDTVHACGADIVLSSTWRIQFSLDEITDMLARRGWPNAPVISKTRVLTDDCQCQRGEEIRAWMDLHGEGRPFVIVDDDANMLPHQPFVHTDGQIGFSVADRDRLLAILVGH